MGKNKLTYAEIKKKGKLILKDNYISSYYINGKVVYKFSNGDYYKRIDTHPLEFSGPGVEVYQVKDELILVFVKNNTTTKIQKIKMMESKTVKPFTGFEPDKIYQLENGQNWQQIEGPYAPNQKSPGHVKIMDDSVLMVDNWSFYPKVELVKGKLKKGFFDFLKFWK